MASEPRSVQDSDGLDPNGLVFLYSIVFMYKDPDDSGYAVKNTDGHDSDGSSGPRTQGPNGLGCCR